MTEPTNEELAEALRSIEGLPLGTQLIVRLAADRLSPEVGDGWIEWNGQHAPTIFKPGQVVETRHRGRGEYTGSDAWPWDEWPDACNAAQSGYWVHDGTFSDIIAYRIVK